MNIEQLPTLLTPAGVARELRCAPATLKRRIESGQVVPDFVLVETVGHPGSLVFKTESLPTIVVALATRPKGKAA